MADQDRANGHFGEGDAHSYRSVTTGDIVTWTRDAKGVWTANDDRGMTATDADVVEAMGRNPIGDIA